MRKEKSPVTFQQILQQAKTDMQRQNGHPPTIRVQGSREVTALEIADLGATFEGRLKQMYIAGNFVASLAIVGVLQQVFFISEGWMSVAHDGKLPEVRPSQDPQRIEVLQVSQLTMPNRVARMTVLKIQRNVDGIVNSLDTLETVLADPKTEVKAPLLEAFAIGFLGFAPKTDD